MSYNGTANRPVFHELYDPYYRASPDGYTSKKGISLYDTTGTVSYFNTDPVNKNVTFGPQQLLSNLQDPNIPLAVVGSTNSYFGINVFNLGTGGTTSSNVVVAASPGTGVVGTYVDLGINDSAWNDATYGVLDANAGFVYSKASNFYVGVGTPGTLFFFAGGVDSKNKIRAHIDPSGNVAIGTGAIGSASTNGFLYIPSGAGAPTGVPTTKTGLVPMYYDTTGNNFYFYNGGWKKQAGTYS